MAQAFSVAANPKDPWPVGEFLYFLRASFLQLELSNIDRRIDNVNAGTANKKGVSKS